MATHTWYSKKTTWRTTDRATGSTHITAQIQVAFKLMYPEKLAYFKGPKGDNHRQVSYIHGIHCFAENCTPT